MAFSSHACEAMPIAATGPGSSATLGQYPSRNPASDALGNPVGGVVAAIASHVYQTLRMPSVVHGGGQ